MVKSDGQIQVVQHRPLTRTQALYIVEVEGHRLLLGVGREGAPRLISKLDAVRSAESLEGHAAQLRSLSSTPPGKDSSVTDGEPQKEHRSAGSFPATFS